MKIFAHRGWSEGAIENTLSAFRKSVDKRLDGVEFDVRYGSDGMTVVCAHDVVSGGVPLTLDEALTFLSSTNLDLLIELKEYSNEFYEKVFELIQKYNLAERTTLFGFPPEAKLFPWADRGDIKLGIIAPYPQDIKKYIEAYSPDMVLMGWGTKSERLQFRLAWSFLSLKKVFERYSNIKFVIGVAFTKKDREWLSKQEGLYGATANMPLM